MDPRPYQESQPASRIGDERRMETTIGSVKSVKTSPRKDSMRLRHVSLNSNDADVRLDPDSELMRRLGSRKLLVNAFVIALVFAYSCFALGIAFMLFVLHACLSYKMHDGQIDEISHTKSILQDDETIISLLV